MKVQERERKDAMLMDRWEYFSNFSYHRIPYCSVAILSRDTKLILTYMPIFADVIVYIFCEKKSKRFQNKPDNFEDLSILSIIWKYEHQKQNICEDI